MSAAPPGDRSVKAVILAGGRGTRITEESQFRPKPMIDIGGKPIIWHIMKTYSHHGVNDFIICCGYKGYYIKEYFANYFLHSSDVTFDIRENRMEVHHKHAEPWRVTVVDTGLDTMTAGRIKRIAPYLGGGPFCMTYGDGVSDVDISAALAFHSAHGRLATMTAIQMAGRYGTTTVNEAGDILAFNEKPEGEAWINGGFFVLDPRVIGYIEGDATAWEREPMARLTAEGQLKAFKHRGFWMCMDHLREKIELEALWETGRAPWKVWAE